MWTLPNIFYFSTSSYFLEAHQPFIVKCLSHKSTITLTTGRWISFLGNRCRELCKHVWMYWAARSNRRKDVHQIIKQIKTHKTFKHHRYKSYLKWRTSDTSISCQPLREGIQHPGKFFLSVGDGRGNLAGNHTNTWIAETPYSKKMPPVSRAGFTLNLFWSPVLIS